MARETAACGLEMEDNFVRAKNILLEAVDTVIAVAENTNSPVSEAARSMSQEAVDSASLFASSSRPRFASSSRSRYASNSKPGSASSSRPGSACSSKSVVQNDGRTGTFQIPAASISEHSRLFGFKPSRSKSRKGKGRSSKKMTAVWKKECICLR